LRKKPRRALKEVTMTDRHNPNDPHLQGAYDVYRPIEIELTSSGDDSAAPITVDWTFSSFTEDSAQIEL